MGGDGRDEQDGGALPEGERPTLKSISYITGLGVTTVSRALKDAPEIGLETRRRVQLVASQIGYRPNRAGLRLRTGKTFVISLVLNTEEHVGGFVSDIIYGLSEELAQTPYHLTVTPYSRNNDPMEPVRYVLETGSADGIVISRTEPNDPRIAYLAGRNFPFVAHGRTATGIEHPFHDFDNHSFAVAAVNALAARGRRRIALLAPPPNLTYYRHMREGFATALAQAGLDEVPFAAASTDQPLAVLRRAIAELLARPNPPDGIVSGAAPAAMAVVAGVEDSGLRLGQEIDLVSKRTAHMLDMQRGPILAIEEDMRQAGRELARSVLGAIEGRPVSSLQSLAVSTEVRRIGRTCDDR